MHALGLGWQRTGCAGGTALASVNAVNWRQPFIALTRGFVGVFLY